MLEVVVRQPCHVNKAASKRTWYPLLFILAILVSL